MTIVFAQGTEGYHTFRIPAIITSGPALLAFAEGRRHHGGDSGDIDLVLRRSFDGGRTWGPLQVVLRHGEDTAGNPCPVVDPASGDVVLLSTRNGGGVHEQDIKRNAVEPHETRRVYVQRSADHGETWSEAVEITSDVKPADWRWYATGPVHAIALRHGPQPGRLVAPADFTTEATGYGGHALLSDDGGHTWRVGAVDPGTPGVVKPNETTVAELPDGTLVFNTRNQSPEPAATRAHATSSDGGETFDAPYAPLPGLVGPVVQGSMIALDSTLLLALPGRRDARAEMTVRSSRDGGLTWEVASVVSTAPAAYSDLVDLGGGTVGLLYETGEERPYEQIRFVLL